MMLMTSRTTESFSPHREPANVTGYDHVDESGYTEHVVHPRSSSRFPPQAAGRTDRRRERPASPAHDHVRD